MKRVSSLLLMSSVLLMASCSSTKLSQSWFDPDNKRSYKHLLILGVAENMENRRAYENHFAQQLEARGIKAKASYKRIKGREIDRNRVSKAIAGMGIDAIIVTHLVAVDQEKIYRPSTEYIPVYGGGYYSGLYSYYPHVNTYVRRPGYYTSHKSYIFETNLYEVESEELIWSARSRTFSPDSPDEVIIDLTKTLINDLSDKKLIKITVK